MVQARIHGLLGPDLAEAVHLQLYNPVPARSSGWACVCSKKTMLI